MDVDNLASLVVSHLGSQIYEDEVYIWEIASVMRFLAMEDAAVASLVRQAENEGFVKEVILAVVRQIRVLPGVETYFTGWPFDGDWEPRRSTMSMDGIIESIRMQLDRLGREPDQLEIAFFRGVEGLS